MRTRITSANRTAYYFIAILVIVVAFLLLGGGPWMRGMMHTHGSTGVTTLHWAQILIGAGIGFVLGLIASRRKW